MIIDQQQSKKCKARDPTVRERGSVPIAIHMHASPTLELFLIVLCESCLLVHVDAVNRCSSEKEREIETISVVRCHYRRFRLSNVLEEAEDGSSLLEARERDRSGGGQVLGSDEEGSVLRQVR